MTYDEKLAGAKADFLQQAKRGDLPHDLILPKFRSWIGRGLEPIPREHYVIEYPDGSFEVELLVKERSSAQLLERLLSFDLDEESRTIKIYRV
jgi:hypothetical protein